jgi:hypothetical protein
MEKGVWLPWGSQFVLTWSRSRLSISTPKKGQSRLSRKSRQFQKVSLNTRDFSIKIEKSRFCLNITIQIQISRSWSRFIKTYRDLPKISIISRSWSRSSYNFHKSQSRLLLLIHFTNRHLWKDVTFHSYLLVKISQKCWEISKSLDKSQKSQFVSIVSICLDDLDKYFNTS